MQGNSLVTCPFHSEVRARGQPENNVLGAGKDRGSNMVPSIRQSIHPSILGFAICYICKCEMEIQYYFLHSPSPKRHYGVNLFFVIASGSQDLTAISVLQLYNPALFKWRLFAKCCYVLLNPHVFGSTWLDRGAG